MTPDDRDYPSAASTPAAGRGHVSPLIDIVVVTAKGSWRFLDDCLSSLAANPPSRGRISVTVVDNASGDGIVGSVQRVHPGVSISELPDNRGFAYACNHAIRRTGAPFILLLNPDTVVHPDALDRLLDVLERHPRAAVAGPRLVGIDGQPDHNAKRTFPTAAAALVHFTGIRVPLVSGPGSTGYGRNDLPERGAGRVDAVSGSCMLVRRAAMADAGLMDEGYWMYGEDLDWCRRFGEHGWEVRYEGSASVLHVKHGVTGRHRTLRTNWAFHRSMGRFYRRFDSGSKPWLDTVIYAGVLIKFVVSAARSTIARRASAAADDAGIR